MRMISPGRLRNLAGAILAAAGSNERETAIVADHLVEANLKGHDSHGVGLIPLYLHDRQAGALQTNGKLTVVSDNGSMIVADGAMASGQVMAHDATELAIARTRRDGLAMVALRNTHHIGRLGAFGEMTAAAGLSSLHFVNVTHYPPMVAPFGGYQARYATNPICISVPAGPGCANIVFDVSTSKVALGKVRVAMNKGEQMPPDMLVDSEGRETRDPHVMFDEPRGAILPMGEHKGSGLALIVELFAGAFCGGGTIRPDETGGRSLINNMLSIVFDPGRLGDRNWIETEIAQMVDYVKSSRPRPGVDEVLIAGEPELRSKARRSRDGIPVDDTTFEQLLLAGEKVGLRRETLLGMVA